MLPVQIASAGGQLLFDRIRDEADLRGLDRARELARGFGLLLREEDGETRLPLILDRPLAERLDLGTRLAAVKGRVDANSRSYTRILVPLSRLQQLQTRFPNVRFRTPTPALAHFGLGTRISESVGLVGADGYQAGNLDGSGVRVAVIDLGFSNLTNAINQGELPADACGAGRNADFTGTGLQAGSKHGTGVAEHVADMAPAAEIHCLKVSDEVDLQLAADYLVTNNIDIANHSVGWVIASYYDDTGPISGIVNDSFDNDGKFWTVSAGNSAQQHWRGGWLDGDGDNNLEFSGTDELLELQGTASTVTVFLNWNQYGVNNKTDLDLYVVNQFGTVVAASTVSQSRFNDPAEAVSFSYVAGDAPYSIRVTRSGGSTTGLDITLFSFSHNFEYRVASSSLMDPAPAHGAFTVGAVSRSAWPNSNPNVRSYSSQGPTTDGRIKPDLVAPDGTSSLTYTTANGTSFSAPTTAGAAALLLQENPARSALDLGAILITNAIDIQSTGIDNVSGAGKLQMPPIDSDDDGLTNVEEIALGTNALLADTDSDGLDDGEEVNNYGTDPVLDDSDGDGLIDGYEVLTYGTDPLTSNRGDLAPRGAPNNSADTGDYLVLSRLVSGVITATSQELTLGDLNDSGTLDAGDLVLLLRVIQGEIPLP